MSDETHRRGRALYRAGRIAARAAMVAVVLLSMVAIGAAMYLGAK